MPNALPNLLYPGMRRVTQVDDDHCGPAVLEMLLSSVGVGCSQTQLVEIAGIQKKILTHGMFIEEMGLAVAKLSADIQFWYKRESTLRELSQLVTDCGYPVGVEWQGIFEGCYFEDEDIDEDSEDDEDTSDDVETGHYSVVTGISTSENWLTLADPYHNRGVDRQLSILEFERRWWDINEVTDPTTGKRHEQDDYHALFLVTPKNITLPADLDLIAY
jgi:predicted double-glycine peptidase